MSAAEDLGDYFRVPADMRDLNYDKFVVQGEERISYASDYNSHNATQLNIKDMKKLLMKISFMNDVLRGDFSNLEG